MKTPLALAAVALCATVAVAQTLESAFGEASAAAASTAERFDLCSENKGLEARGYRLELKGQAVVEFTVFAGCRTRDWEDPEPTSPRALRVYKENGPRGYQLWIETEPGSDRSSVTVVQDADKTLTDAGYLGEFGNDSLAKEVSGPLSLTDWRTRTISYHRQARLTPLGGW